MKTILLASVLAVLSVRGASANLTIDLRAVGLTPGTGSVSNNLSGIGKLVKLDGDLPAVITLQVWAQVTSFTAPPGSLIGIQALAGSIISAPGATGPAVLGSMSIASLALPFNGTGSTGGVVQELTVPADGSLDLGSTTAGTKLGGDYISPRKDAFSDGSAIGSIYFASNYDSTGATIQFTPGGYEFLMATTTFTVSSLGVADGSTLLNWLIPARIGPTAWYAERGRWTDGDGTVSDGNLDQAEMFVAAPVQIIVVPEPGSLLFLMAGGLGLLCTRRRRG